jgi:lambda family phage tail tape measure protein
MAQNIARLGVVLGIDTAEFQKGIDSAKNKIGDLITKIPAMAAVGVAAFTAMAAKAMQFSDTISDTADSVEVSVGFVLKLRQALELSGGSAENAGKVLEKFAQNVNAANDGSQAMLDNFKKVGITTKDLATMPIDKLFLKASDGIDKLGDSVSKTGSKLELFGKGMRGADIGGVNAIIKEGTSDMDKYAEAVKQAADLHDKLNEKATQMSLIFTEKVLPTLNAMFDSMNTKGGLAEMVFTGIKAELIGMWIVFGNINDVVQRMAVNWQFFTKGMTGSGEHLNALNELILNEVKRNETINNLLKTQDDLQKNVKKADEEAIKRVQTESPEAKKLRLMVAMAALTASNFERELKDSMKMLDIRNSMAGMTENERKVQEEVNRVIDATSKKLSEIQKQREAAVAHGGQEQVIAQLDKEAIEVERLGKVYADTARIKEESSIASQRTFEFGWNKAFKQYAEDANNYGKLASDMFNSFTSNMSSAIDKFVDTGKLSFSDLANSIIKDLLKIQLKMAMSQSLSSMFGGAGGGGLFGNLFGGGATEVSAVTSYVGPAFADGGSPPIGVPSLVGERGPELFVPNRPGTIIPNNQLSSMMNANNGITYNGTVVQNMQAIDTQSALQFLAKNKMGVYSANQSAARSIPTSR